MSLKCYAEKMPLHDIYLICNIFCSDVAKSSGTKLSASRSREAGFTTFVIRGTRCQIREALRQITVQTGQWVG